MSRHLGLLAGLTVCTFLALDSPLAAQYFGRNKVRYKQLDFQVLKTDHFDIYYHFDLNLKFENLLVRIDKTDSVPSVTSVYFCAFLPENEMRDLFGISVEGLNIDYDGHFLLTDKYDRPPLLKDPQPEKA